MTGLYSVSWPEHATDRTASVKNMLEKRSFVDVTIACDDDQLEAHKVLLSAASPFFQRILERNPHNHPLLYLRGSLKKDVSAILDFIYSGETSVPVQDFESFMSLAKDLEVKGLVDENELGEKRPPNDQQNKSTDVKLEPKEVSRPRYKPVQNRAPNSDKEDAHIEPKMEDMSSNLDMEVEEVELEQYLDQKMVESHPNNTTKVLKEDVELSKKSDDNKKLETQNYNDSELVDNDLSGDNLQETTKQDKGGQIDELNAKVDSLLVSTVDGFWVCNECRYGSKNKAHVREHIEMHIDGVAHKCKTCNRVFTKRTSLRFHTAKCQKK